VYPDNIMTNSPDVLQLEYGKTADRRSWRPVDRKTL
jgi:hypothetical protein